MTPSVEDQTSFLYVLVVPPMTHILLSKTAVPRPSRAAQSALEVAWVQVVSTNEGTSR